MAAGNDELVGDGTLIGGLGNDFLEGGASANLLFGNEGEDTMVGGAGADTLMVVQVWTPSWYAARSGRPHRYLANCGQHLDRNGQWCCGNRYIDSGCRRSYGRTSLC